MPTITFTSGDDTFIVSSPGDYNLIFLAGNDTLTVDGGTSTTATMGDGDDHVLLKVGGDWLYGEAGSDRFDVWSNAVRVDGGADNDLINIRGGVDQGLDGGDGDDRFNFYAGATGISLAGSGGNDDFYGYHHAIAGLLFGGGGNDSFTGFVSGLSFEIYGGFGNDVFRAHPVNPAAFVEAPGEGTDTVQVARGIDYDLGENIENISVQTFSGNNPGPASLTGNQLDNVIIGHANVETMFGGNGNDTLSGKGGDDLLNGAGGNDRLDGGAGNDTMYGSDGNDTLQGRAGNDSMLGGDGNDSYYIDSLMDSVNESVGQGTDVVRTSVTLYTLPGHVENGIVSGAVGLELAGNDLANLLIGGTGNDILKAHGGNDTLKGGNGDDVVYGYDGNDVVIGGNGNDILAGNWNADTLTGGAGDDSFIYLYTSDSAPGAADDITDFQSIAGAGGDKLNFGVIDANAIVAGDQAFTLWNDGVSHGNAGDLWFTYTSDGGIGFHFTFYGDVGGDGVADFELHLHSVGNLYLDDFVL